MISNTLVTSVRYACPYLSVGTYSRNAAYNTRGDR